MESTRKPTQTELIKSSFAELMKGRCTSIPGHLVAYDPERQVAQIQVGIEQRDINGNRSAIDTLVEVPVYMYGGSFCVEVQLDPGHEGIVIFSQRCIDGWFTTGGVADNPIARFHDMNDAMFLPGLRSMPNTIPNHANNGIRLRDQSGSHYIWLKNDGTAEIKVSTLKVIGNIDHIGSQTTSGTVTAPTLAALTSLTVVGKEMDQHHHLPGTYKDTDNNSAIVGNSGDPV